MGGERRDNDKRAISLFPKGFRRTNVVKRRVRALDFILRLDAS